MSEVHAWDLDGTIRPGSLLGAAITHGIAEGFINPKNYSDPSNPTYDDVDDFQRDVTNRSHHDFRGLLDYLTDTAQEQAYPWAIERLQQQSVEGEILVLSHSPAFLVKAFCSGLRVVSKANGSHFHTSQLVFSGRAVTLDKRRTLSRHLRALGAAQLTTAAGDSLNDLPLLEAAHLATVVNPDVTLADIAAERGWEIVRASS